MCSMKGTPNHNKIFPLFDFENKLSSGQVDFENSSKFINKISFGYILKV